MILPEYAMQDPALALAPLFLSRPKRERRETEVHRIHNSIKIRWHAKEALNIFEQSVYLTILAIAGQQRIILDADNPGKTGKLLLSKINYQGNSYQESLSLAKTSLGQIALLSGHKSIGGKNRNSVQRALCRLAETTALENRNDAICKYQLLAWSKDKDSEVVIALNPRASAVLQGEQYVYISLAERRTLSADCSKGLHAWLSGTLHAGRKHRYLIDGLQEHVWGDTASGAAIRTRRSKLLSSLLQISKLPGWTCEFYNHGLVEISRH